MKISGRILAALMVLALFIGAGVTYAGISLFGIGTSQEPFTNTSDSQQGSDQSSTLSDKQLQKIAATYELIQQSYFQEVDGSELYEGAIEGMVNKLEDPYSSYMDPETADQFAQSLESSFEGIGAEVKMSNGNVTIVSPFKGSPAEKAGLRPNDQIVTINGESIEGLDLNEAVLKIRGEKGTEVTLGVKRPGATNVTEVEVTRDEIPIETVYSSTYERNGKTIGVIEITSFSENTAQEFNEQLSAMEDGGINGLVIDVRGNPGGILNTVQQIGQSLFTDELPFVQIEKRNGDRERFFASASEKKPYPIVGLIDEGSASASEILAAALKEAGDYELVGQPSFGKGTVQQTFQMNDDSNIKLTIRKWLTPKGNWIHEKGVKPTVAVEQPDYFYAKPLTVDEGESLTYNSNSDQVSNAQVMLEGLGYAPGRTDGYFDEQTESAVKAFQNANDLEPTGKVNSKTASQIEAKLLEAIQDPENDRQLNTAIDLLAQ